MDTNEEKFNIARQLHFSGRIEEAQKIYVKLLKIYKKNHTLYYLIGTTYLQLKKQDLAIKYFKLSLKYNSNFPDTFNNLGVAVWLQDVESKYVLQSTEASLVTNLGEENKLDMLCFPNPSNGAFNLVLPQNIGLYNLEVYDLIGNLVYQLKSQERYNQINLEQLNAGIYQLKIQNDSYRLFKKIELLK